jgi:electron transport complex protein RnfG
MSAAGHDHGISSTGGPPPAAGASVAMIRTLVAVAAVCGLLIVTVYQLTLPAIKANRAEFLRNAVYRVIPGASGLRTFRLVEGNRLVPLEGEDERAVKVYAGYGQDGALTGVALEAQGQGFQDVIKVIYGYDPQRETVVGMMVLDSKETPGLGDKIGKDRDFLASLADLDVTLNEQRTALRHPVEVVKHGTRSERWQIDAITGATISSKAVGKLLGESAQARLPLVQNNLDALRERK